MKTQRFLAAAALIAAPLAGFAQVATVDGVGGVATVDPTFTTSYTTVEAALTAIKASGLNVGGQTCEVSITANNATAEGVAASLDLDTLCNLIIDGDVSGSTYGGELAVLRLTASDATGSPAGTEGIAVQYRDGQSTTFRDLVLIPNNAAAAGAYNHRMFQIFNTGATDTSSVSFDRVIITARRESDDTPVLNPFVHAASADTKAARAAEFCAFDGGGGNNAMVFQNSATVPTGGLLTVNLTDTYFTHLGVMAAAASKGGGIAITRTRDWTFNVNGGCVFSYLDGSGIRTVGSMVAGTTALNINGTLADPVFFINNGWMEDASSGRNEHVLNDGSAVTIDNAYFVGSFQEALELGTNGADSISNTYIAETMKNLDASSGAIDTANVGLVRSVSASATAGLTFTNCTLFENYAATNDSTIHINNPVAAWTLNTTNCVIAGANDQVTHVGTNAVTWNEDDCGYATAGSYALASPYIVNGTGLTRNSTDRVEADPSFASTTFAPSFSTVFAAPGNLTDYLRLTSFAYDNAAPGRFNPVAPVDVVGANANSTVPVTLDGYSVE